MIGLDTNVLIRYLVQDDEAQAARAAALIEDAVQRGEAFFVTQIVLCEVVWVLKAAYGRDRAEIAKTLSAVIRTAQFAIQEPALVHRSLTSYERGPADFADCLLAEQAVEAGCEWIATFDKGLVRDGRFFAP